MNVTDRPPGLPDIADVEEERSLNELHYWLRYAGFTGGLVVASFWLPFALIAGVLTIGAVLFTPYMLWHLTKARWYRAVVVFAVFVLAPVVAVQFVKADALVARLLLLSLPLLAFYLFTWSLRYFIGEHLRTAREIREIEYPHADRDAR